MTHRLSLIIRIILHKINILFVFFQEITIKNDDLQRATEDSREQAAVAERRVTLMATEIDELRSGLEQAER